jgi:hypothetical protein
MKYLRLPLVTGLIAATVLLVSDPADAGTPQPPASTAVNCTAPTGSACPNPPTQPGGLDHFLCYYTSADSFTTPLVTVQDQFNTYGPLQPQDGTGFVPDYLCNPVQKTLPGGLVYGVSNPTAHLVCFNDATGTGPPPGTDVSVTNQFGSGTVTVGKTTTLCVPSWKFDPNGNTSNPLDASGSVAPTSWTDPGNLGLNHFQCYSVTTPSGATGQFTNKPTSPIGLDNQFGHEDDTVGNPVQLCAPAIKTVVDASGNALTPPSLINADGLTGAHLLCFGYTVQVSQESATNIQVGNEFSQSPVAGTPGAVPSPVNVSGFNHPISSQLLCLPSFKTVLPPPNTPEVPVALLLPAIAGIIGAGAVIHRRRSRAVVAPVESGS